MIRLPQFLSNATSLKNLTCKARQIKDPFSFMCPYIAIQLVFLLYLYCFFNLEIVNRFFLVTIIESVDSISRDERDVPLTQYITNA